MNSIFISISNLLNQFIPQIIESFFNRFFVDNESSYSNKMAFYELLSCSR